jgi:NAD(P)-dependent dehydrogenase (short-subunit alcohol dehydrogenase family)
MNEFSDGDRALAGKAIIITGAASGIGRACAELTAQQGARLLLVDRDADALEPVAGSVGGHADVCDLGDTANAGRLVERCVADYGAIDGLVNAAGVFQTRPLLEITVEDYDRLFTVNVRGLFFLQQAAARVMAEQGRGSIVNLASTAARVGRPHAAHYAMAKAAVVALTQSAAAALGAAGVRVNAVCPGLIETPMIERIRQERADIFDTTPDAVLDRWESMIPMRRLGTAPEVAAAAAFLLSDAASYITGESLGIHGGTNGS